MLVNVGYLEILYLISFTFHLEPKKIVNLKNNFDIRSIDFTSKSKTLLVLAKLSNE